MQALIMNFTEKVIKLFIVFLGRFTIKFEKGFWGVTEDLGSP